MNVTRISVLVFAFQHENFLEETLEGILRQTAAPDEIVLCDDASSDQSRRILCEFREKYADCYSFKAILKEKNEGLAAMLNDAFRAASGDLWVLMAGDDVSCSSRIQKSLAAYRESGGSPRMIVSNALVIDIKSQQLGRYFSGKRTANVSVDFFACGLNGVLGATQTIHKEVWEVFGEIPSGVYQEDLVLPFRAALLGGAKYLDEPLVHYRLHGQNTHFVGLSPDAQAAHRRDQVRLRKKLANYEAVVKCRIEDIGKAKNIGLLTEEDAGRLLRLSEHLLDEVELESKIAFASRVMSLKLALGACFRGVRLRRIIRVMLQYHIPFLYNAYVTWVTSAR